MPIERKLVFDQGAGTGRRAQVSGGGLPGGGSAGTGTPHNGAGTRVRCTPAKVQGAGWKLHTKGATGGGASNTAGGPSKPALCNVLKNSSPTINSGI